MVKEKGVLELVSAIDRVNKRYDVALLVVGSKIYGKTIKDQYLLQINEIVRKTDRKIIFTGYIPYDEIVSYYSACDIGILPTLWEEPLSLSVIEYMSTGLPVIVSDSGGMVELLKENCGYVIKKDDKFIQNIAHKIEKLIDNQEMYNSFSRNSVQRAISFDKQIYCQSMWNYFSSKC